VHKVAYKPRVSAQTDSSFHGGLIDGMNSLKYIAIAHAALPRKYSLGLQFSLLLV
jgi:hypothetical protein